MQLGPYVDTVRHDLAVAADAGGADARALAERLTAPLESAIRLVLLEALAAAAEEITADLAPGSVDVRVRGREPEFVVVPAAAEPAPAAQAAAPAPVELAADDGATWRITLRIPEYLKPKVDAASRAAGVSLNTWFVRTAAAAVEPNPRSAVPTSSTRHISGWVR